MQKVDKDLITKRFRDSLKNYDSSATVQKTMATKLVKEIVNLNQSFNKVFELGCGTGILTKEIAENIKFSEFFCNDLTKEAYEFIKPFCKEENFYPFDAELTDKYQKNLDLIISGAVFQWFEDLPKYLRNVSEKLCRNGIIAFSTFGREQFFEISQITGNCLKYFDKDELIQSVSKEYDLISFSQWKQTLEFNSVKEIMKHIKETGVSGIGSKTVKKMPLTEFRKKYREKFLKDGKLPLTYNPQIWILRRKG
jgi:malonyl-ACP O-methyltransferase BioC